MLFITVVPAIRTVPGVERFDYLIDEKSSIALGDIIQVTFRKKTIPALVVDIKSDSLFKDKIIKLESSDPVLCLGEKTIKLLENTARHVFVSEPTILHSWIRHLPKRRQIPSTKSAVNSTKQLSFNPERSTRYLVDRLNGDFGLLNEASRQKGRSLIITPWQHGAKCISERLECPLLTAETPAGQAWKNISRFVKGDIKTLVATRLGAWLSIIADCVLLDEPENDDFKQDELSPRFDARWIIQTSESLRPELPIISFSTTPILQNSFDNLVIPEITVHLKLENIKSNIKSEIDAITPETLRSIDESLQTNIPTIILHPIKGLRSGLICRDCGWRAVCASCGYQLGMTASLACCKKCGLKTDLTSICPNCGGADLSRGGTGKDRIMGQLQKYTQNAALKIVDISEFNSLNFPKSGHLVITDLSLIGGMTEDIRRRERLIINWRRLAAKVFNADGKITVQGSDEILEDCRSWLTVDGLKNAWQQELKERKAFGYPPASYLIKIIITGNQESAEQIKQKLSSKLIPGIEIRGPYPVAFRPKNSTERHILHLVAPLALDLKKIEAVLNELKKQAIIDLDPIAFFC
ncbi:MAG: hypothetical protein ABIB04_01190 [Patescibacteria group bacterium]